MAPSAGRPSSSALTAVCLYGTSAACPTWSVGYFRSNEYLDVFATLRRGKLGSEVGFLLDGRNGEIVWESKGFILPENGSGRSLGGHPSAAGDVDGDGLEEIVVMWPDRLHIVDGVTGTAQVVRQAYGAGLNPLFESDSFVGYAFPAVVDLFGDSRPESPLGTL